MSMTNETDERRVDAGVHATPAGAHTIPAGTSATTAVGVPRPAPPRPALGYRVAALTAVTPSIVALSLRPLGAHLEFAPGQYVLLQDEKGRVPARAYSVANAPRPDGELSLLVTRAARGAASTWVHEALRSGEVVRLTGPFGSFVDDPAATAPGLYLAAGSGLAPIRSLVEAALADGRRDSLTLVFSARTEADVIDGDLFERWQTRAPRFRFIRTLTRASGPPPTGRVPELLPSLGALPRQADVFVAGAPGFVAVCTRALLELGASRVAVHSEVFYDEPRPWGGAVAATAEASPGDG
jgi:CDP-4-dehydro-6-deoxyglucose reductase, E3